MKEALKKHLLEYLTALDSSIEKLSQGSEGKISDLPSWILEKRKIVIGLTSDNEGWVVKITPSEESEEDFVAFEKIKGIEDISSILAPWKYKGPLPNKLPKNSSFTLFGDISLIEAENPIAEPVANDRCLFGWGRKDGFFQAFNIENAKKEAVDF